MTNILITFDSFVDLFWTKDIIILDIRVILDFSVEIKK